MTDTTSRRDFLNGCALTIAAGLTPAQQLQAQPFQAQPFRYPPALTGMRGQHPGAFEVAHALAREGQDFSFDTAPLDERYDLVVVGAGISGLAAAYFYRKQRPGAKILILDNHDDFGGHAKRNEFRAGDRLILGYGGSESLQSPNTAYSAVAKQLLVDLGVDVARFETAFERSLYPSLGLSRGVFFDRVNFGRDVLVTGDPFPVVDDDIEKSRLNGKPLHDFVAGFPISAQSRAQLLALYEGANDPYPGLSADEKTHKLDTTSYRDFIIKVRGCNAEVANCFQGRTLDFAGSGCDTLPASFAREIGYPGFGGLGLPEIADPDTEGAYIHHFPDGNASIARLLVRALIPGVAPGSTMDDIVLATFDYAKLDDARQQVRLRLDSTCLSVKPVGDSVILGYVRQGKTYRVRGDRVVLACFNMIVPYIMPGLPEAQRNALSKNIKAPLVYTKVLVRNWEAWKKLGVHEINAPMGFHSRVKLDYPVSLGGYRHPRDPSEPMGLHLVHVPGERLTGLEQRDQFRLGRMKLLDMTFADFESHVRDDLDRMLGPGGFSSRRDIMAITVNRWSHGYSYSANTLYDDESAESTPIIARQPAGRVAIANSDSGWEAYAHVAIDQAARAVTEVLTAVP